MKYRFSDCELDLERLSLRRGGVEQRVEPQVLDLVALLVRQAGTLVSKEQMIDEVWGGRIVSESAISACIASARRAVGDDGKRQAVIATVARRGLRLVAEVVGEGEGEDATRAVPAAAAAKAPRIRYATADDGVKIAFAVSGQGPPLLRLAHHPTHLELEWSEASQRKLFDALGAERTLIRMDQRGCGLSDLDVENFSTERSARDVMAVLDTLGLERVPVFGSSSGAMIAVECAARFPDRVSRLVTLAGYVDGRSIRGGGTEAPVADSIMGMITEGWATPGSAFVLGYLSVYFPTAPAEELRTIARNIQQSCPVENEIAGRTFFNHLSIADRLPLVRAPTLVMHSQDDAVHPLSEAQKLARGIAGAELLVLDSPNDYPFPGEAAWQEMIETMLEFLREDATTY